MWYCLIIILIVIVALLFYISFSLRNLNSLFNCLTIQIKDLKKTNYSVELFSIEDRLDAILDCFGRDFGEFKKKRAEMADADSEVLSLIEKDRKIGAIMRYRHISGKGLKESKDDVEHIIETLTQN